MTLRCPSCLEQVDEFMGRCTECRADLVANPPVEGWPIGTRSSRALRLTVIAAAIVTSAFVITVVIVAARSGSRRRNPAGTGHLAGLPRAVAVKDPLAVPGRPTGSVVVGARGNQLLVVHVDRGQAETVDVPVASQRAGSVYRILGVGDSLVVFQGDPSTDSSAWAFGPEALAGRARPTLLGTGVLAFPDLDGRVWLVSAHAGQYSAHSVGLDGRIPTAEISLLGAAPVASLLDGFVVESAGPAGPELRILSGDSRAFVRSIGVGSSPVEVAAAGPYVAWRDTTCNCAIHLFDQRTGTDRAVPLGAYVAGNEPDQASISADGTKLAFGLVRKGQAGYALGIVDIPAAKLNTIPLEGPLATLLWSADGHWLFRSDGSTLTVSGADGTKPQQLGSLLPWAVIAEHASTIS